MTTILCYNKLMNRSCPIPPLDTNIWICMQGTLVYSSLSYCSQCSSLLSVMVVKIIFFFLSLSFSSSFFFFFFSICEQIALCEFQILMISENSLYSGLFTLVLGWCQLNNKFCLEKADFLKNNKKLISCGCCMQG